jgi:hypothetical protein
MTNFNAQNYDPHSNLAWKFDAVHGNIDISDAMKPSMKH